MRSPSLTCKMPFAAFPSPHHPITFNFCTLEEKKIRYENKIQPALRVDFVATANCSCVVTVRDSRCNPLTNYPQLLRYVSQTAIRCFSAVDIYLVAGRSCVYWSFCFGGCGSACCSHLFSCAHISSNGYLHLLVHIGKIIAVIDYCWHCY